MKKLVQVLMVSMICLFGGNAVAQPRVTVTQDAPPPEPCAPGQPREYVDHIGSGQDETVEIDGLKAACLELTVHLPKAMDPAFVPTDPTAPIDNDGDLDRHGTNTHELIEVSRVASEAASKLAKRQASWNFGPSSQILAVSHKGKSMSYGLLGVYGVRSTKSTLVQLSGGIGKDTSGQLGIGAQLIAGFKVGGYTALGLGIVAADSVDQRGNKDEEVLMLRSVGAGPSITMQLGPVNMAIAGGVAWSGKPINGLSVDGVLVKEPGRSYALGPFGTVSLTLGLRGLLK
jgi:hypothetical protein